MVRVDRIPNLKTQGPLLFLLYPMASPRISVNLSFHIDDQRIRQQAQYESNVLVTQPVISDANLILSQVKILFSDILRGISLSFSLTNQEKGVGRIQVQISKSIVHDYFDLNSVNIDYLLFGKSHSILCICQVSYSCWIY